MHLIIEYNPFNRSWQAMNDEFMKATVLYKVPQEIMESMIKNGKVQRDKPVEENAPIHWKEGATEEQKYYYLYEGDADGFQLIKKVEK